MTEIGSIEASGDDGMNAKERRAARRRAKQTTGSSELDTKNDASVESAMEVVSGPDASAQGISRGPSAPQTDGMNSKERRAARRKAQQDSATRSSQPEAVAIDQGSPPVVVEGAGMNANARLGAKRAAERAEMEAGAPTAAEGTNANKGREASSTKPATVSETTPEPTTAKERRAARRAAAREALSASAVTPNTSTNSIFTSALSETVPHATGTGGYSSTNSNKEGMTSKERRLRRRQEERRKHERDGDADRAGSGTSERDSGPAKRRKLGGGGGGASGSNPNIVFVGQLAFTTTAKALENHFRTRGDVEGKISVRLLTRKGTNPPRSKGMAFVELEDAETAYHCLTLHHSRLDGRLINVERTSGGGKEKRGERIRQKRGEQKEFMKTVVQRVLGEFVETGRLGEDELDDAAKGVLEKMEAKVMERAVKDYCDKPDRLELHNPSAWFTHHAHELAFRADPEDLDAGARDWLVKERSIKDTGRRTRGDKGNEGSARRSQGAFGGRGREQRRGGGRGRGGTITNGSRKHGVDSRVSSDASKVADDVSRGQQQTAYAPGDAPGVLDTVTEHPVGGSSGDSFIQIGQRKGNTSSDLVSIFPSLRGRGGSAAGRRGGRGRGSQQQGRVHA